MITFISIMNLVIKILETKILKNLILENQILETTKIPPSGGARGGSPLTTQLAGVQGVAAP